MKHCRAWLKIVAIVLCSALSIGCTWEEEHESLESKEVDIYYIWSLLKGNSTRITRSFTIRGTVVANDKLNELNKSIVVVDDSGGIEIAIDSDDIDSDIPLFSEVEVSLSGLHIGRVGNKCVIGKPPTGEYVVDRIAREDLFLYIKPHLTTPDIPTRYLRIGDVSMKHLLNYICVEGVHFIAEEHDKRWCDKDSITHRYITTIRHLTDGVDTLRVIVDKACEYSSASLPIGDITCFGIVDYDNREIALRISDNQVLSTNGR